ncbi:MAG: putative permease [Psychromonas sp.]|uniref:hypothetical protein n=1 Tax=Psychromonas sp. TaxID=1884585 RepID=UPI0039E464AA
MAYVTNIYGDAGIPLAAVYVAFNSTFLMTAAPTAAASCVMARSMGGNVNLKQIKKG